METSAKDIAKEIKRLLHSETGHTHIGRRSDNNRKRLPLNSVSLDELRRIFAKLIASSEFSIFKTDDIYKVETTAILSENHHADVNSKIGLAHHKWNTWLRKQHNIFLQELIVAVRHGRRSSLRTFLGVIASTPDNSIKKGENSTGNSSLRLMVSQRLVVLLIQALISPYSQEIEHGQDILVAERDLKRPRKSIETNKNDSSSSRVDIQNEEDNELSMEGFNSRHDVPVGPLEEGMVELLEQEFLEPYYDARYFTLTAIRHVAHILYHQQQECFDKTASDDSRKAQRWVGTKVENLIQILLKIPVSMSQSLMEPKMNKQGICCNYLFPPPTSHLEDEGKEIPWKDDVLEQDDEDDDGDSQDSEDESKPSSSNNGGKRSSPSKKKTSTPSWQTLSQHRLALQQAYLDVLKIPHLRPRILQQILTHLPTQVLPHISSPLRFADFCTRAYQMGGMTSILALQSLFLLMMDHGLEYPNFYTSLYQLIEPSIFYAKFRTRFLQLLTKCLYSNPILPAYVVAAFMKRLCQCALSAPPAGCLYIIALVSNLLRKHPECACLIHRGKGDGSSEKLQDPFDCKAQDPVESRAIESSLWELVVLEKHYYHAVATMAKVCGTEGEDTLLYDMDEFVQHSYKSLFEQEKNRAGKRLAPLTFQEPQGLFQQGDVFDGIFNVPIGKQN